MLQSERAVVSRRDFLAEAGALAGVAAMGAGWNPSAAAEAGPLPTRVLGRTGVPITMMTLGTAPCGLSEHVTKEQIADIVNEAIDLGITSIDTAPKYIKAEEGVGRALGQRRKSVFLATKVWADTIKEAEASFSESLRLLKTDYVDLVYYHSVGHRKLENSRGAGGVFTWLQKQKQAGKTRFLGISAHHMPGRCKPFLESGDVDVLLTVVNFVDRYTYKFEDDILPIARKHNVGVVAMKVLGGALKMNYNDRTPQIGAEHVPLAVRYALDVPGVTTVNLGVYDKEQLRQNVALVRNYQPLEAAQKEQAEKLGRELAGKWGPHFGPVA